MNYEGRVTSVHTTMMTFEVDNNLTIHTGHLATSTNKKRLPEVGEHVKIHNAHFMLTSTNNLEKLFVCDRGQIVGEHYTDIDESAFSEFIDEHNLGCSDLHTIDANIPIINDRIKGLAQSPAMEIMFEIIRVLADTTKNKNEHKCLNKIVTPLTLKTVSDYRFVDLHPNKEEKMPVFSFGSHSKDRSDKLLGFLQINKRYGMWLLRDKHQLKPCVIVNGTNSKINLFDLVNKFVVVRNFRVFTETYREDRVPSLEYICFDVKDILVLPNVRHNNVGSMQQLLVEELPQHFPYVYNFKFKILKKATVNINKHCQIECWLEVLLVDKAQQIYLGLNAYQVQITPLLQEGLVYEVYHSDKLNNYTNKELSRMKSQAVLKFQEKTALFVYVSDESSNTVLSVAEVFEKVRNGDIISVEGIVSLKKLTPALSSRTKRNSTLMEFGTPGTRTHTVALQDGKRCSTIFLYLNNWENSQMPLGLIPGMRVSLKNVIFCNKYLRSTALTSFEILNYEPPVLFDTVNLCQNLEHGCDKYSYLGWGDLIPSNVLVWSRISVLFIRSLKIKFNCVCCLSDCVCPIHATLTFYMHDEFGGALVLSKSMELLRLILGLEPEQWKIWCSAFKEVKEYVYNNDSECNQLEDLHLMSFCEALTMSVQTTNACRMSNLELKCRKIDSSSNEDNNGMSLWFCVDARIKEWSF